MPIATGHGRNSVVKFDNRAGSLTDFSAYVRKFSLKRTADTADTTAMGDKATHRIAGLDDASFDVEGPGSPTVDDALDAAIMATTSWTVETSPRGTSSGRAKQNLEMVFSSYDIEISFDDVVTYSASADAAAAITDGTN